MKRLKHLPWNLTWGPNWSWGPMWSTSSRSWLASVERTEDTIFLQNPQWRNMKRWVEWRGWMVDTPSCWWELEEVPEVEDTQELAQKIWVSFELPWCKWGVWGWNYHLAPLVPQCLHQKDFLLLPYPRFPCQDIQEEQWKKTLAYALALQYWAERANLPTPGWPCLLVRSVL